MKFKLRATFAMLLVALTLAACGTTQSGGAANTPVPTQAIATETGPPPEPTPTPKSEVTPDQVHLSLSPDGAWEAETVLDPMVDGMIPVRFTVRRTDGSQEWAVIDEQRAAGLGFPSPEVIRWLPDSLFYSESAMPDGCGFGPYRSGLFRVGLTTGESETLLERSDGHLVVSEDGSRAAYELRNESGEFSLQLLDLVSGGARELELPMLEGGLYLAEISWSPAGKTLLLTVMDDPCRPTGTAFYRVGALQGEIEELPVTAEEALFVVEWQAEEQVILQPRGGTPYLLHLESNELAPVG